MECQEKDIVALSLGFTSVPRVELFIKTPSHHSLYSVKTLNLDSKETRA